MLICCPACKHRFSLPAERDASASGGLTVQQRRALLFICGVVDDRGVSPSFTEIGGYLGLRSRSGVHRLIAGLEERGYISRLPGRARAIEILRRPT